MPRFSIIIPVYRRAKLLHWAIDSLIAQRFADWEALVVDDGSGLPEVTAALAEAEARDPRVYTFALPVNQGVSAARNLGIQHARGDYIAFLDSDDLFHPWTLATVEAVTRREGEPAFLAGSASPLAAEAPIGLAEETPLRVDRHADFLTYRATTPVWWFAPSGVTIRADILRSVSGFWPHRDVCEDLDLWYRLGTTPGFIRIQAPPVYAYRLHGGSVHHTHRVMHDGLKRIIATEHGGGYPGGAERQRQRLVSLAAHARHHAMEFSSTNLGCAWDLYRRSFRWNLRLGRAAFLVGFPVISCWRALRCWLPARLPGSLRRKRARTGPSLPAGG